MVDKALNMEKLVEAGVHIGHDKRRSDPGMRPYIFGERNSVEILDLEQTLPLFRRAGKAVREVMSNRGNVLFVGTRPDTSSIVEIAAKRCGQHYITNRWVGGTLTNWKEIFSSIDKLRMFENSSKSLKSYSPSDLRKYKRLKSNFEGIMRLDGLPDIIFIVDTNRHRMAIKEATKLNIPTIGIVDNNSNPEGLTYAIPGNDDPLEAVYVYSDFISNSVLEGLNAESLGFEELVV